MLTKKQIILRITVIFATVEYFIMLFFAHVLPNLSNTMWALLDVFILVLITTPTIYFAIINPFIISNNKLMERIRACRQLGS